MGPTVGEPLYSGKKKTDKRNIFCPGCGERYEESSTEDWT
jgi:hypothetical protein